MDIIMRFTQSFLRWVNLYEKVLQGALVDMVFFVVGSEKQSQMMLY